MIERFTFELFHCNGGDMTPDAQGEYVSYDDYAELQQKLDAMAALAAENAMLKAACTTIANSEEFNGDSFVCDFDSLVSVASGVLLTPATDTYLNSVRAEGVDMVAEAIGNSAAKLKAGSKDWKSLKSIVFTLVNFAANLRSGTHDTADKAG